jgi:hypothetical protein
MTHYVPNPPGGRQKAENVYFLRTFEESRKLQNLAKKKIMEYFFSVPSGLNEKL